MTRYFKINHVYPAEPRDFSGLTGAVEFVQAKSGGYVLKMGGGYCNFLDDAIEITESEYNAEAVLPPGM